MRGCNIMKKLFALFLVMGLGCMFAPFMLAQTLEGNINRVVVYLDTVADTLHVLSDTTKATYLDFSKYNAFHVAVEITTSDTAFDTDSISIVIQYNRIADNNKSDEYWVTLTTLTIDEVGGDTLIRSIVDSIIVMDDYMEPWFRAIITLADSLVVDSAQAADYLSRSAAFKYDVNVWLTGFIE